MLMLADIEIKSYSIDFCYFFKVILFLELK